MRRQDALHLHIVLARIAEYADDFAEGVARSVGPIGEMDDDLHAILGTAKVATRDEDVDRHPLYIGADEDIAVRNSEHTHKLGMLTLKHLHNLAFGLAVVAFGKHGHAHTVAMQRLVGVGSRDENVLAFAVVAHHVGLARRLHLHRAFHILRLWTELRHTQGTHHIAIGTRFL